MGCGILAWIIIIFIGSIAVLFSGDGGSGAFGLFLISGSILFLVIYFGVKSGKNENDRRKRELDYKGKKELRCPYCKRVVIADKEQRGELVCAYCYKTFKAYGDNTYK